LRSLLKR